MHCCSTVATIFLVALATSLTAQQTAVTTVPSRDGTPIGVECTVGTGPATLLFVHGGVGDRSRWVPMFPLLAGPLKASICSMDRRGRGASGDNKDYAFSKESEDIAAVVDSRPKGQPVYVFGHSFGGVASLEAAFLTRRITRLMLYEPPLRDPVDQSLAVAARVEALVNKGDLEQAFIAFQTEVVRQSPQEMARMRSSPNWSKLVATIAVHPRQMYAIAAYRFDPKRVRTLTLPVLLLEGEITPSPYAKASVELLRQTLPNPTVTVLKAQEHNAMDGGRDVLAQAIINFIRK